MTPITLENKSLHSPVPDDPSPENILEVSSPITLQNLNNIDTFAGYNLPFSHNCDKPPNKYSLEVKKQRSKYPIANNVTTMKLYEPLKAFADKLSIHIRVDIKETLTNTNWVQAIKEERP